MRAIIGHSDDVDTASAIEEVLSQCHAELRDQAPCAALLFMSPEYESAHALARIQECWPGLPVIGCTTDGEVSSRMGFCEDSMSLTLFAGSALKARSANGMAPSESLDRALDEVMEGLGDLVPKLCIVICPGVTGVNPSELLRELHARMGERACPIVGGLAGAHEVAPLTRQFFQKEIALDSISVLFLGGELSVSWGVASGWFPIGQRHTVTRSEGGVVYAIDGQPALEAYKQLWNGEVKGNLGESPLAVLESDQPEGFILRAGMSIDQTSGSVRFAGDVPQGSVVQLTEVLPEGLLVGTQRSLEAALAGYPGRNPAVALMFSCAARKWVLGGRAEEEIRLLQRSLADGTTRSVPFSGFYAFGEICPLPGTELPLLHNETCVTVLIGRE